MSGEWDDAILAADYDFPALEELGFELEEPPAEIPPEEGDGKQTCTCPRCGKDH
jgi:hypothetical protein